MVSFESTRPSAERPERQLQSLPLRSEEAVLRGPLPGPPLQAARASAVVPEPTDGPDRRGGEYRRDRDRLFGEPGDCAVHEEDPLRAIVEAHGEEARRGSVRADQRRFQGEDLAGDPSGEHQSPPDRQRHRQGAGERAEARAGLGRPGLRLAGEPRRSARGRHERDAEGSDWGGGGGRGGREVVPGG